MSQTSQFLASHSGSVLFIAMFAEQIGLPLPAAPLLVAAGALAADGVVNPVTALTITLVACLLPDLLWFGVGRRGGNGFLRFICRLALCDSLRWTPSFGRENAEIKFGSQAPLH